jgi:hypothetical protein
MIKKLSDVSKELNTLYVDGLEMGKSVGWQWEAFPYTIRLGSTTYLAGAPASGKSEFWFEMLINLSCLHGWKHVIYSPETGSHIDVYSEIMHKFVGKPYVKNTNMMSASEKLLAETFVEKHFFIVDDQADITIDDFYKMVDKFEKDNNVSIQTTTVDPWNELKEDYLPVDLGREDRYLSRVLGMVRKNAKATNRHHCVITHVRDQKAEKIKDGDYYYPMPTARDFAGGQVWFRKGMSMLIFWRPPVNFLTFNSEYATDNELHVRIAKTKPKGTSKNGVYKFFLNLRSYRYYVKSITGGEIYSNRGDLNIKHKEMNVESAIKVNENFDKEDLFNRDSIIEVVPF